jgi:hypothetical protein
VGCFHESFNIHPKKSFYTCHLDSQQLLKNTGVRYATTLTPTATLGSRKPEAHRSYKAGHKMTEGINK